MHPGVDIVGRMQGVRQRVEQAHPPMVLRSRRGQGARWSSGGNRQGKGHTQRHGLGSLLMTHHQATAVKHHHRGINGPVPFGGTGSDNIERARDAALDNVGTCL